MNNDYHQPVLVNEILAGLNVHKGGRYIDATVGDGGHTGEILKRGGTVLGIDRDEEATERTKKRFETEIKEGRLILMRSNFDRIKDVVGSVGVLSGSTPLRRPPPRFVSSFGVRSLERGPLARHPSGFDGILFDLGMSSWQVDESGRGFSFMRDEPLDMRMDREPINRLTDKPINRYTEEYSNVTAADLVNGLGKKELVSLFLRLGQVERAGAIAEEIVRRRREGAIKTTAELAGVVEKVSPRRGKLHPATKVFMALRMAVNDELGSLERALPQAVDALVPGGRLAVISFHEGEDRIVKRFFRNMSFAPVSSLAKFAPSPSPARTSHMVLGVASDGSSLSRKFANFANLAGAKLIEVNKKPIVASKEEIEVNPRARSAKLRIGVRREGIEE